MTIINIRAFVSVSVSYFARCFYFYLRRIPVWVCERARGGVYFMIANKIFFYFIQYYHYDNHNNHIGSVDLSLIALARPGTGDRDWRAAKNHRLPHKHPPTHSTTCNEQDFSGFSLNYPYVQTIQRSDGDGSLWNTMTQLRRVSFDCLLFLRMNWCWQLSEVIFVTWLGNLIFLPPYLLLRLFFKCWSFCHHKNISCRVDLFTFSKFWLWFQSPSDYFH